MTHSVTKAAAAPYCLRSSLDKKATQTAKAISWIEEAAKHGSTARGFP